MLPPLTPPTTERNRLGDLPPVATVVQAFQKLPSPPDPAWRDISGETTWTWALGSPDEGLNVPETRCPITRTPVVLPHRVLHPDTPYWYVTTLTLATPVILRVSADDGAQVWANGKRIPAENGSDFPLIPNEKNTVTLTVRVLNKAVYGGLNRIFVVDTPIYRTWQKQTQYRQRLTRLVQKLQRHAEPSPQWIAAVQAAIVETASGADKTTALEQAEKLLATVPQTRWGPILQDARTDQITLLWETDAPCQPMVEWSEGYTDWKSAPVQSVDIAEGALHTVWLSGLKPDTGYRYRLRNTTTAPALSSAFRTLPSPSATAPFTFTVWADSQMGWATFRQNIAGMQEVAPNAAFTVGVGDLIENAQAQNPWHEFFDILTPLAAHTPAFLVPGNHDYDGCFEDLRPVYLRHYLRANPCPEYFAWTAGNARFVALDPNCYFPTGIPEGSPTHQWLLQEFESLEWKSARWHFIFIHQPPLAQGWAEYHGDDAIRTLLEPLYERHQIDFVVSGHAHDYERLTQTFGKQKVHFVIVGGAGGGLEDEAMSEYPKMDKVIRRHHFGVFKMAGDSVEFRAIATDLRVLDQFTVSK
jgi:hypothetical protein